MTRIHPTYRTRRGLDESATALLAVGRYTVLGTENPDGSVHMTPVMYLYDDGRLYIETSAATRKARNVLVRPRATILVQDDRAEGSAWVSGAGPAELLHGDDAHRLGRRIRGRYLTERGEEQMGSVMAIYDDVVLAVTPEIWMAWDTTAFYATLESHGLSLDDAEEWLLPFDA
ncbi:MAG: pyridoxamine 5'-phosphate oxidase family protein [Actinomycetota bacterium]